MTTNMQGKICLVTGANAGIGYETTRGLAQAGATVIMVCRNAERGINAQQELMAATGNQNLHLIFGDLSVQAEVRRVAAQFCQKYDHLDVLVNNAGAIFMSREESADGIELTWALNHMGYFLLTQELLGVLQAAERARVVNVSSDAHYGGQLHMDDLQLRQGFGGFKAYSQSKLANVHFTYELARRLANTAVTSNCLHPGFVASNFAKNNGRIAKLSMILMRPFAKSESKGAETSLHLALSPALEGVTGRYFADKKEKRSAENTYDVALSRQLWEASEALLTA
jgi:NAD(P)-dependent dehydrogenase (short-subunit alcohol dehydrogenase family)